MYIVKKRKRTNVLKQQIKKGIYVALMFIGFFSCLNWGIEYLRTVSWFVPKTIEILNREVTDSTSYDLDSLVPTGELPYVESDSEASGVKSKPPVTSIKEVCEQENFADPELLIRIAKAESSLNPKAQNFNKNGTTDKGIFQINSIHKLSDDCVFSVDCSTRWAINKIKAGGLSAWNSSRAKWDI